MSKDTSTPARTLAENARTVVWASLFAAAGIGGIKTVMSIFDRAEAMEQNNSGLREGMPTIEDHLKKFLAERPQSMPLIMSQDPSNGTRYGIDLQKGSRAEIRLISDYNNCAIFEVAYETPESAALEAPKAIAKTTVCPQL